jgi:hypothetical protein
VASVLWSGSGSERCGELRNRCARRQIGIINGDSLAVGRSNRGYEAIANLRNRLHGVRSARIIVEDAANLGDGTHQDVIADEDVAPHNIANVFPGEDLTRIGSKDEEHLHDLGLQMSDRFPVLYTVDPRLDQPFADEEIAVHFVTPAFAKPL